MLAQTTTTRCKTISYKGESKTFHNETIFNGFLAIEQFRQRMLKRVLKHEKKVKHIYCGTGHKETVLEHLI